jgi:penicillin G amidase
MKMLFASRKAVSLEQRLSDLPRDGLPLTASVNVHWDNHQIPFIEAENDEDLAVTLGIVHVHLRWGQMEIMRRLALGRVSEMIGPFGVRIDHAFRALGLARVAASIAAILPRETAQWLDSFVIGINHAIDRAPRCPPEFRTLGISRERWRIEDILALERLAAADVTWPTLITLLRERDKDLAASLWRRALGVEGAGEGRPAAGAQSPVALALMRWLSWTGGSNSIALAPSRSASGGALLASDPHLPVMLPSPFLVAGYKSPSFHAVGLMIPGLPFVALGRNPRIAWGATNLHAASSDLFEVSDLPQQSIRERRERIRVRWTPDRTATIRESPLGPVVSDLAMLGRSKRGAFALRWVGDAPSDEITAMLRVNRANNWDEFRAAFGSFAVPGQTLTYADVEGHIGKIMAARLPRRSSALPGEPVRRGSDADEWRSFVAAADLPIVFDPADGLVASANEKPSGTPVPVGYVFSSSTRREQLDHLLAARPRYSFDDLAALQQDVSSPWALKLRDDLVRSLHEAAGPANPRLQDVLQTLAAWDGRYTPDSRGALCFELFLFFLIRSLIGQKQLSLYSMIWNAPDLIRADIAAADPGALAAAARRAAAAAARKLAKYRVWGAMHRLRLSHPAALLPIIGRRFRFGDWPLAGGGETVSRTAHALTARRHHVVLAALARHISDLSDPDANYFVLLGGQDGWLRSTTMLDQVPLWQEGRYIRVPLTPETVRRTFLRHIELRP